MKLHLICHGMMLFWYRKPDPGPEGYTILIPQGFRSGKLLHLVGAGIGVGAPNPHPWLQLDSTDVVPQRRFELRFALAAVPHNGVKPPENENLSFYENPAYRAVENPTGIAFAIDIPYPHSENPMRVATYEADPYVRRDSDALRDRVVKAFTIAPRRIVAARLLSFEITDPRISLYEPRTGQELPFVPGPSGRDIKLHLYSQPAHLPGPHENHTEILNDMLHLETKGGGRASFDLKLNPDRKPTLDPDTFPTLPDLGFTDHLHLWELAALYPQGADDHGAHGSTSGVLRFVDPAECGQGGGC
jgi:hypothetical protein